MVHKKGTLTNLELALFNAVALVIMSYGINDADIARTISRGGRFAVSTKEIAKRAGYPKLTAYHYKLLNRLVTLGYLDAMWETTRVKNFSVAKAGWDWLGIKRIETYENSQGQLSLMTIQTQMSSAYTEVEDLPF